jgi:hypothetical protein
MPTQPHVAVPLNVLPTCLADQILQRFIESRRLPSMSFEALGQSEAAEGLNVGYLLDPDPCQHADTISHIVTDIVKTYTEIDTLPKQVAILYIIKLLTVRFYSFQRDILHVTRCRISGSSCAARTHTTTCRHG